MEAHRIETTVTADGELTLTNVPVHVGDQVEVIVLVKQVAGGTAYSLRGTSVHYDEPTEPVAAEDWEASR